MRRFGAAQSPVMRRIPHFRLDVVQQSRTQLDDARLVRAMHVAERERGHVSAVLAQAEPFRHAHAVGRGGIQFFVDFRGMAVLFAADRADFDFQHGVRLHGLLKQFRGDVEIFLKRHRRTVPHVRLERRLLAALDLLRLVREQRPHPLVQILLGAVVGVQGHGDVRITCGHFVRERGEGERSDHTVVHALAGEIGGTAHGHLDDAVGFSFGEALQRRVQRLRARYIDRGIRVSAAAGGIQHLGITFRCCDSHASIMPLLRDEKPPRSRGLTVRYFRRKQGNIVEVRYAGNRVDWRSVGRRRQR